MKKFSISTWLLFLLPSILGIILFMIPLKFESGWKVPIAKLADTLSVAIAPIMPWTATIVLIIAALGSVLFLVVRKEQAKPSFITGLFKVSLFWTIVRIIGAVFALLVMLKVGPEAIWNENTGGLLLTKMRRSCHIPLHHLPVCRTTITTSSELWFTRVFRNDDGESDASVI